MPFAAECWCRIVHAATPIYLRPDGPDWFVPNAAGDAVLVGQSAGAGTDTAAALFLDRLPDDGPVPYRGRQGRVGCEALNELWLHITNDCNLACTHCLFCSGPAGGLELATETALARIAEARELGCRVFAMTGGEPFRHSGLPALLDAILADPAAHAVVLTNGTGFTDRTAWLADRPRDRLHFQVSCDGLAPRHDALRGPGAFARLLDDLAVARGLGFPVTLSVCPTRDNLADLPVLVDLAAASGAAGVHLMWHFAAGRGRDADRPDLGALFAAVIAAADRAQAVGLDIDNLTALRSQVFAPVGTRHDGTTAGCQSVAVGPDDRLYPSPALVGVPELSTSLAAGLDAAWRESPVLTRLRRTSRAGGDSPWRLILGGGDPDHGYRHGGSFDAADPYQPLLERLAAWTIAREAAAVAEARPDRPGLRLKMGETHESCHAHGDLALTHTNCLLSLASQGSLSQIKAFYTEAAKVEKGDIVNPVCYPPDQIAHIPEAYRVRGYGCGSPIADAGLAPGETMVDLGCGAGVECLIAAKQVGPAGRVIGLDMLPAMLARATAAAKATAGVLGYANAAFFQGYLEAMPLPGAVADCVTSNCVLNLSTRKRRLYAEIFRILKPGGRLVFSDVATETPASAVICNDPGLRGECIAGTLTLGDLFALLEESGFEAVRLLRRFPYRVVHDHAFYSVTVEARRPLPAPTVCKVLYRGPFRAVVTSDGTLLRAGEVREVALSEEDRAGLALLTIDERGRIANPDFDPGGTSCCCGDAPTPCAQVAALLGKSGTEAGLVPLAVGNLS